jgi:hypothetical protein
VTQNEFSQREYDALRSEERDRMNGRTQVWATYLTIAGAFGFVSLQSGMSAYTVVLCPLLLACLARHVRHSEDVLKQVRKYLYQLEKTNEYCGYEHFTRAQVRPTHGGYMVALRDAFLLTDILAVTSILVRLYVDHGLLWVGAVILLIGVAAIVTTWRWFARPKKKVVSKPVPGLVKE